jgi:sortase A
MKFQLRRKKVLVALGLVPAVAGAYIFVLVLPTAVYSPPPAAATQKTPPASPEVEKVNRIIIPKINVEIPYLTGGPAVLNESAWHRYPERGDPARGGNFIISGHRFRLGLTPGATKRKSPFYHINKLEAGDKIYVDFETKRYEYEITRRYVVKPHQTEIEAPSQAPKLTLYTCTFKGEHDGREVVEATPLGEVGV